MEATSFWRGDAPLVLASGSATRRLLLDAAGIPVEVSPAEIDERAIEEPLRQRGASPAAIALHLAAAKAQAVSAEHPERLVLGADQTLDLDGALFTKPADLAQARRQLQRLAGRTHVLHSAWALVRNGESVAADTTDARLTMRAVSPPFLDAYLAAESEGLLTSVGAYKLEGLGIQLFTKIEGDHSTILGLPLLSLLPALRQQGYLLD